MRDHPIKCLNLPLSFSVRIDKYFLISVYFDKNPRLSFRKKLRSLARWCGRSHPIRIDRICFLSRRFFLLSNLSYIWEWRLFLSNFHILFEKWAMFSFVSNLIAINEINRVVIFFNCFSITFIRCIYLETFDLYAKFCVTFNLAIIYLDFVSHFYEMEDLLFRQWHK